MIQKSGINLKYPVLLCHGAGFRDDSRFYNYWGRIPSVFESYGIKVFYSGQDAWGTIEKNAEIIKLKISHVLKETGSEKVNLIAHSRAGLECRYVLSSLNMSKYVASLTTVSTPHYGSKTMDLFSKSPGFLYKSVAFFVNQYFRFLGDKQPDFYCGSMQFTSGFCTEFNIRNPNMDNIYYQSYASKMKYSFSDMMLFLPHLFVKFFDGENDGICPVESAKWGDFKGVIGGEKFRGVSHADAVDYRKKDFSGISIPEIYIKMLKDLQQIGY